MKQIRLLALLTIICASYLPAQIQEYNETTRKRGISDYEGRPIIPAEYDEVRPFGIEGDTFYVAKNGNFKGLFNHQGKLVIPFEYEELDMWAAQSHMQFGYVVVTKNRRSGVNWGMLNGKTGKEILPQKFEFVRAIYPDLLVARQFADSTLQFFNAKGEALFQLYGRSVAPGFDQNVIEVRRVDRSYYFADKKGKPIFPAQLKHPTWTDGERVICDENGKFGLVSMDGEILVPFQWNEMKAQNPGHFLVKNEAGDQGLIDASGKLLIPLSRGGLYRPENRQGTVYIKTDSNTDPRYHFDVYDGQANLLFSGVNVSTVSMPSLLSNRPNNRRQDYFSIEFKDNKEELLFHLDRGQILPTPWSEIWYGGEKHALLTIRRDTNGRALESKVFGLNGKLLFDAPPDMSLEFTYNPSILLALTENRSRPALLYLDHPEKLKFEYSTIAMFQNGYFMVEQQQQKGLLDPNGKVLVPAGKFKQLSEANKFQHQDFFYSKSVRGRLVAIANTDDVKQPSWLAINQKGETFLFGPKQAPVPQSPERVEESEEILEEVPEQPKIHAPTGPDEVLTLVEQRPQFPGGDEALNKFLADNLVYPPAAKSNGITGKVALQFIIEKDGSISNLKILRDIGAGCGKEALRLVQSMPKWIPGKQNGRVVRVQYTLPVVFRLD